MHELSKLLWPSAVDYGWSRERVDSIIRQYLTEKSKKFDDAGYHKVSTRAILDLTQESDSRYGNLGPGFEATAKLSTQTPNQEKEWCEHWKRNEENNGWTGGGPMPRWLPDDNQSQKFCSYCGSPRPKPKTLAEKFKEAHFVSGEVGENGLTDKWFQTMTEIAKEHYEHFQPKD